MLRGLAIGALAAAAIAWTPAVAQQQAPRPQAAAPQRAQQDESLRPAPNRRADEGKGPYRTLVIRGAMLIDGTGAPPACTWRSMKPGITYIPVASIS